MTNQEESPLAKLARRFQRDPRYMAYVLAVYQRQEGLTDEALARELGTPPALVVRLALCRRPHSSSMRFAEDVRELADYTLTDDAQLASIIRQVDALEELAHCSSASDKETVESNPAHRLTGLLAAARDRDDEPIEESSPGTDEADSEK